MVWSYAWRRIEIVMSYRFSIGHFRLWIAVRAASIRPMGGGESDDFFEKSAIEEQSP